MVCARPFQTSPAPKYSHAIPDQSPRRKRGLVTGGLAAGACQCRPNKCTPPGQNDKTAIARASRLNKSAACPFCLLPKSNTSPFSASTCPNAVVSFVRTAAARELHDVQWHRSVKCHHQQRKHQVLRTFLTALVGADLTLTTSPSRRACAPTVAAVKLRPNSATMAVAITA